MARAGGTRSVLVASAVLFLMLQAVGIGVGAHSSHSHDQKADHSLKSAVSDTEHIDEHLQEDLGMNVSTANMTAEERAYYYFRLHDHDRNNQLDGLEMLNSWTHYMEEANVTVTKDVFDDLIKTIDGILETDDKNRNGYLDYSEYQRLLRRSMS